jgi:catechol 2,3-dioxygenase-like lactoylglutathione lyase family enzyme
MATGTPGESPLRLRNVVLDCPSPRALAEFYREVLGWPYVEGHDEEDPAGDLWLALEPPGGGPRVAFQASEAPVPPWPEGSRAHVDVIVRDLADEHERVLACGARALTGTPEAEGHPEDPFRVYADPAGHPFCLMELRDKE